MYKIGRIIKYNSFAANYEFNHEFINFEGVGICILPSYFNHSCVDQNIFWFFLGDLMFVRSLRPIYKDEELVFSYSTQYDDYEERSNYLKIADIDCQCRLCKLDGSESQRIKLKRAQLLKTYKESIKPSLSNIKEPSRIQELKEIIDELRGLRMEHPDLDFYSMEPIKELTNAYRLSKDPIGLSILKESYNFSKKSHRWSDSKYNAARITTYYMELKQWDEAFKWFEITFKEYVEPVRGTFKK